MPKVLISDKLSPKAEKIFTDNGLKVKTKIIITKMNVRMKNLTKIN